MSTSNEEINDIPIAAVVGHRHEYPNKEALEYKIVSEMLPHVSKIRNTYLPRDFAVDAWIDICSIKTHVEIFLKEWDQQLYADRAEMLTFYKGVRDHYIRAVGCVDASRKYRGN